LFSYEKHQLITSQSITGIIGLTDEIKFEKEAYISFNRVPVSAYKPYTNKSIDKTGNDG